MSTVATPSRVVDPSNEPTPHNATETSRVFWQLVSVHRLADVRRLQLAHRHYGQPLDVLAWDAFGMPLSVVLSASAAELADDWRADRQAAIRCHARARSAGWQAHDSTPATEAP